MTVTINVSRTAKYLMLAIIAFAVLVLMLSLRPGADVVQAGAPAAPAAGI